MLKIRIRGASNQDGVGVARRTRDVAKVAPEVTLKVAGRLCFAILAVDRDGLQRSAHRRCCR